MSYISCWAHEKNWVVINIPSGEKFVDGLGEVERAKNGLFLQYELASELLKHLLISNKEIFLETPVDMSLYGKMDYTGHRDGDPEPVPRVWDERRKVWSDHWKDTLYEHELNQL